MSWTLLLSCPTKGKGDGGGCRLVDAPSSPLCVAPLTTIAVNHNLAPSQTSFCLNVCCLRVSCSALYWNVDYVESRLLYGTDRWLDGWVSRLYISVIQLLLSCRQAIEFNHIRIKNSALPRIMGTQSCTMQMLWSILRKKSTWCKHLSNVYIYIYIESRIISCAQHQS